jgi:hypothetical protein
VGMEHERSTGNIAFQGAQISLLHPVAEKGLGRIRQGDDEVVPLGGMRSIANIDIACHYGYGEPLG